MGTHSYQWDAEGRLKSVDSGNSQTYVYNALGQRVQEVYPGNNAWDYLFDQSGRWLGASKAGTFSHQAIPSLGRQLAAYLSIPGAETYFIHSNNLDSTSMTTDHAGNVTEDMLFYPWGQLWTSTGTLWEIHYGSIDFFDGGTGTNNAGLNQTLYRSQSGALGRWMSPDPLAGDITNPQSLNRYAYVMNNPMSLADPLGLGPPGGDPCGKNPYKAVCGGDAASSEAACMQAGLTPNCAGPLGSGELATAEMAYEFQLCSAGFACLPGTVVATENGGIYSYYQWVPKQSGWIGDNEMFTQNAFWNFIGMGEAGAQPSFLGDALSGMVIGGMYGAAMGSAGSGLEGAASSTARESVYIYSAQVLERMTADEFHSFPLSFDEYIIQNGTKTVFPNGYVQFTMDGTINGVNGSYQIGLVPSTSGNIGVITHHFFKPWP